MSRILLLGGYGGFGGRIARRLAAAAHEVIVAGRDLQKAKAFCADQKGLKPVRLDRSQLPAALAEHAPTILIDASGPFQRMDMGIPLACIAARVHYLDIADARAFVCGVTALDHAAKAAGVTLLSGASSVPALSGAVARHLAEDMDEVRAVEMAISASNRATAGPAVAEAILAQVGKPMTLWRGRREDRAFGWQEPHRIDFEIADNPPIRGRTVALVDVPDLALLPERLAGRPAVVFRAGTELAFHNCALWLASWLVRWGWIHSLGGFARWLRPLQRLSARAGSDRSAMSVVAFGTAGQQRIERRWTLIADRGDGPEIPTLSVLPLIERILAGKEPPGARDAGTSLTLADYAPAFATLAIRHATVERVLPPPLYARIMGDQFDRLPSVVREMHAVLGDGGAKGSAIVTGAGNPLAALIARIIGFPRTGTHPLHVAFAERDGVETWTRLFSGRTFHSRLSQHGRQLVERFGPLRFGFDLPSDERGLAMVLRCWWIGPIRFPLALAPRLIAREWEEDGRFHFDVQIALPLIGRIVHYRGWLEHA